MDPEQDVYDEAPRFRLEGEGDGDGEEVWVLLAEASIDGRMYGLLAEEGQLTGAGHEMDVVVYRLDKTGPDQIELQDVEDDQEAERAHAHFAQLMGLEGDEPANG